MPRTIIGVQYLRGVAALMVVAHHARGAQPWLFDPLSSYDALSRGVDIFFVISGFIMFTAARDEPAFEFARRRVIRIAPMYWTATAVALLSAALHGILFAGSDVARSLLFVPFYNDAYGSKAWPILVPGWTLNFEMLFYLVFAVALLAKRPLLVTGSIICGLVIAGLVSNPESAILTTYTDPILLEFMAGALLGKLFESRDLGNLWPLLPIGFVALLAPVSGLPDVVRYGIPAVCIVTGTLALESRVKTLPLPKLLGDASYSIYLFHIPVIAVLYTVFRRLPVHGWLQFGGLVGSTLIISAALGILIHYRIERPLTRSLMRLRRLQPTIA